MRTSLEEPRPAKDPDIVTQVAAPRRKTHYKNAAGDANKIKIVTIRRVVILGILLAFGLTVSTHVVWPLFQNDQRYLIYLQVAEVGVAGFFVVDIVGSASYKLVAMHSQEAAKAVLSLNRIIGAMIIIAIITSYLSRDPIIAVSISTISGLVVGFASQNIIGNLIAGMYLVLARPFKIGDKIVVFDQSGIVSGIELLYCRIIVESGDVMLAPNSSLVTTSIVIKKKELAQSDEAATVVAAATPEDRIG
jgi:small-conductance mechanosensitive channel